jgi:hypothetical protein
MDPLRRPEHESKDGVMECWSNGMMEGKRKEDRR